MFVFSIFTGWYGTGTAVGTWPVCKTWCNPQAQIQPRMFLQQGATLCRVDPGGLAVFFCFSPCALSIERSITQSRAIFLTT